MVLPSPSETSEIVWENIELRFSNNLRLDINMTSKHDTSVLERYVEKMDVSNGIQFYFTVALSSSWTISISYCSKVFLQLSFLADSQK